MQQELLKSTRHSSNNSVTPRITGTKYQRGYKEELGFDTLPCLLCLVLHISGLTDLVPHPQG
jgi:hypothetical protein